MYLHAFHGRLANGFTLVELSVVIVIISLLTAGGLAVGTTMVERAAYVDTNKILDQLNESLKDYYIVNGRLPCPAAINTLPGTSTFGVETACSGGGVITGTQHFNAANGGVRIGMVPVRTLGLSDTAASDKYGSRIIYVVSESLTNASSFGAALGAITIKDTANNNIINEAAYALYSHGRDRKGSFAYSNATLVEACSAAATLDKMNCEFNDSEFRDAPFNKGSVTAYYFDDLMRWAPKFHLMAQETQSSSLWAANGDDIYSVGTDNDVANTDVGIGTASPEQRLHVAGSSLFDTSGDFYLYFRKPNTTGGFWNWTLQDASSTGLLMFRSRNQDWSYKQTLLTMDHATGNVGVGTSTPAERLQVSGGSIYVGNMWLGKSGDTNIAPDIHMSESGLIAVNDSLHFMVDAQNTGAVRNFHFYKGGMNLTTGTKIATLSSNSNLFLGLDGNESSVNGSSAVNQRLILHAAQSYEDGATIFLLGRTYATHPGAALYYAARNTSNNDYAHAFYRRGGGATTGLMRIETDGDGWMAGSLTQNSDARLKQDIAAIPDALEKLQSIRGVSYRWNEKTGREDTQSKNFGVVAQEVQKVFPELVGENEEGYLTVNAIGLVAPLIEAVKELKAENDSLRTANEDMRETLAALQSSSKPAGYNPLADYRFLLALLVTVLLSATAAKHMSRKR